MLKLFVYERLPDKGDSKLLRLLSSDNEFEGKIFQEIPTAPFKKMVKFVEDVRLADYILLPHEYYFIKKCDKYLKKLQFFSEKVNKKVIIFDYGDVVDEVKVSNSVILRTAGYRSELKDNEIIVPPFVEDLGEKYGIELLLEKPAVPRVGFAGMVKLPNLWQECKFQIRIFLHKLQVYIGKRNPASLQGLYFRRRIVLLLRRCVSCSVNFIIRNSFSANESTIKKDPAVLRKEYIDIIKGSALNLVVRGDGNYSLRFFEVLSLGRTPLFIDTDSPLPWMDEINYDAFMVRVDHSEIESVDKKVDEFWSKLDDKTFFQLQEEARKIFETKLRVDVFYKDLFTRLEKKVIT